MTSTQATSETSSGCHGEDHLNGLNALLLAAQTGGSSNSASTSSSNSNSTSTSSTSSTCPSSCISSSHHPKPHPHHPHHHSTYSNSHPSPFNPEMPPPPPRKPSRDHKVKSQANIQPSAPSHLSDPSTFPIPDAIRSDCFIPNCPVQQACPTLHSCSKACQESPCQAATSSSNALDHSTKHQSPFQAQTICCDQDHQDTGLDLDACWDFGCEIVSNPSCNSQTSPCASVPASTRIFSRSKPAGASLDPISTSSFCETCDGSENYKGKVFGSFQELLDCCCCSTDPSLNLEACCALDSTVPPGDCCSSLDDSSMETCGADPSEVAGKMKESERRNTRTEEGWYETFCEQNHHRHDESESCHLNDHRHQHQHQHHPPQPGISNRRGPENFQNQFNSKTQISAHSQASPRGGSGSSSSSTGSTPTLSTSESSLDSRSRSNSTSNGSSSSSNQVGFHSFAIPNTSQVKNNHFNDPTKEPPSPASALPSVVQSYNVQSTFGDHSTQNSRTQQSNINDYCQLRIPHQHDEFGGCLDPNLTVCGPLKCNVEAPHSHLQFPSTAYTSLPSETKEGDSKAYNIFKCGWGDCGHVAESVEDLSSHVQSKHILGMKDADRHMVFDGRARSDFHSYSATGQFDNEGILGSESRGSNGLHHQHPLHQQRQQQQERHISSHLQGKNQHSTQAHNSNQSSEPQLHSHPHTRFHSYAYHQHEAQLQEQQQQHQHQHQHQQHLQTPESSSSSLSESQLQLQEQVILAFEQCLWDQCQIPMTSTEPASHPQLPSNSPSNGSSPTRWSTNQGDSMLGSESDASSSSASNAKGSFNTLSTSSSSFPSTLNAAASLPGGASNNKSAYLLQHLISDHLGLPKDSNQILHSLGLNGVDLNTFLEELSNHTREPNSKPASNSPSIEQVGNGNISSSLNRNKRKRNPRGLSESQSSFEALKLTSSSKRIRSSNQVSRASLADFKCNSQSHSHGRDKSNQDAHDDSDSTLSPLSKLSQDSPDEFTPNQNPYSSPSNPANTTSSPKPFMSKDQSQEIVVNPNHICDWINCGLIFENHEALTKHVVEEHVGSGKSTYECKWKGCERAQEGRLFTQRQKVLRHMQTHTGDRPHKCSICSKRFSEPNTLTQHMRTHTNEKPYVCDYPNCGKSFAIAGSLTIHKRTHTGDKPFLCPHPGCGRAFSESSNLTKHMRIHSGERPFKCPDCDRCFSRPDQMNRHRKVHRNGNPKG